MKTTRREIGIAWFLCAPMLLGLLAFTIVPAVQSLMMSFQDIDPFSRHSVWIGLENYIMLLTAEEYWQAARVSLLFLLYTAMPSVLLGLAIAVALEQHPWVKSLLRTIFLLPVAISSAMAAMLWVFLYNPTAGFFNYSLELLGVSGPNWLSDPNWALVAVAIATVWKELGFNIIFFLAGLAQVPQELHEAATLDGAGFWRRFWHVTLPILSPTLFFVLLASVMNALQSFGQIHILTAGGPAGATNTLIYNLYQDAFVNFRSGYASAQAVLLFIFMLLASSLQFWLAKRRVHYG